MKKLGLLIATVFMIWMFMPSSNFERHYVGEKLEFCVPKLGYVSNIFFLPIDPDSKTGLSFGGCYRTSDPSCLLSKAVRSVDITPVEGKPKIRIKREIENSVEFQILSGGSRDAYADLDFESGFYVLKNTDSTKIWMIWRAPAESATVGRLMLPGDAAYIAWCTRIEDTVESRKGLSDEKFICVASRVTDEYRMEYRFALMSPVPTQKLLEEIGQSIDSQLSAWRCE